MARITQRSRRSPETVFVHVFVVAFLLGLFSLFKASHITATTPASAIAQRSLEQGDQECRLVHSRPHFDQCAFVRNNCPDEEAGLLSYLELYYCSLQNARPVAFTILVVWLSILFSTIGIAASDFLCLNLSTIASIMGMSESLTGVTFLAFGNGSPDVFSTFAAFSSHSGSLAVGELMGAAGFITAVVAGSMAITKPFRVAKKAFIRDVGLFAVAAGFSLSFLKDGSLRLWECVSMVVFYIAYVIFVVAWHWWFDRRRKMKLAENAARLHHHIPDAQELDVPEVEDDEESRPAAERTPLIRTPSAGTVPQVYAPETPAWAMEDIDDDDEEARDQYLAALSSNMRITRPGRDRKNTITPIRPSLIGALEFRSVLSALEKKGTGSQPIHMRRYSDEGSSLFTQTPDLQSVSHPELVVPEHMRRSTTGPGYGPYGRGGARGRTVSASDADGLGIADNLLDIPNATPETVIFSPNDLRPTIPAISSPQHVADGSLTPQQLPRNLLLSPNSMSIISTRSRGSSQSSTTATRNGFLAPPDAGFMRSDYNDGRGTPGAISPGAMSPLALVPKLQIPQPGSFQSGLKSPLDWRYTDSPAGMSSPRSRSPSLRLPPPSVSPESHYGFPLPEDEILEKRHFTWWPYKYLPAPQLLLSTLFPGLYEWTDKTWPDKLLALCTAPSIFLLTITLPVVESKTDGDEAQVLDPAILSPLPAGTPTRSRASTIVRPAPDSPSGQVRPNNIVALPQLEATLADDPLASSPKDWNRWLAIVQCFTAPLFIMFVVWANLEDGGEVMLLVKLVLGSLVFSLIALGLLLATTTPDREPKYRPVSCFLGFLVAIAWISTIANEVVGVLKTFGVVLNISDAILGLTIFAVGNSLGDLVADITVAKLGFPMMALSACFGGPMLNILLGIGVGGLYQTLTNAQHKHHKHPDRPIKYQPYELEVNMTLMISGITLLITLLFLLVVVPWNKWRMDRKIGVGLIAIWAVSTVTNLILEIIGVGQQKAEAFWKGTR